MIPTQCTNGEHPHAYRKQLVIGSPRPSSRMLQWLSFMRAMHDMFPSGKYNPKDPATEDEVEAVLRILRAALATVRVAFTNYHETGQWEEPNLEFADPILIPASSPEVSSTALPLLPSLLSRSSPPPATQPRTCVEWLLTPTKRLSKHPMHSGGSPSTPSTSSTVTSLFSPVSMVSPGTTPDTSTSKSTLDPFATKGKRKYQSTEGTPTRPTKKPKCKFCSFCSPYNSAHFSSLVLGTIDLTTEDCDAGVEDYDADVEDNTKWMVRMKKGKSKSSVLLEMSSCSPSALVRAFGDLLRGPCNEGGQLDNPHGRKC